MTRGGRCPSSLCGLQRDIFARWSAVAGQALRSLIMAFRKTLQVLEVTQNQRELLRVRPTLELCFAGTGFRVRWMRFAMHDPKWQVATRKLCAPSRDVNAESLLHVLRAADVEVVTLTFQNVNPPSHIDVEGTFRAPRQARGHSPRGVRSTMSKRLQARVEWWTLPGSNRGPPACDAGALTN